MWDIENINRHGLFILIWDHVTSLQQSATEKTITKAVKKQQFLYYSSNVRLYRGKGNAVCVNRGLKIKMHSMSVQVFDDCEAKGFRVPSAGWLQCG